MKGSHTVVRLGIVLLGTATVAAAGVGLFVVVPTTVADVFGVVLALAATLVGFRFASNIARSVFPAYNVAEVAVEGPITRDGGRSGLSSPGSTLADDVVDQIERADEDGNVDALLVKLNTPGGQVLPSDDIKLAAERFDGPTIAYATDLCASGGYWIASGCDELWARDASIVGSIGVVGSRVNAAELVDRVGLSYEQFTAGAYKDAGIPLKTLEDHEREYLQGIVDGYYESFVERVSDGRGLDPELVRETEARVYLGADAFDIGLVDALGTREDVEEAVADRLGIGDDDVVVEAFEPERPLMARVGVGARSLAYAFGAGLSGAAHERGFRLRT
ncbi:signal peptide peptidase SppA [Natronosalvus rutilus]|uniref:Signal peptide peptidase SppA n=1 Tax=Natronosalvus rutilus TaxID=2953753 RepID=A0A9E7NAR1_9EURY|nr:signal peptide peptidase SppA [Natronosalvus rutilus]UTF53498.1 signal peptide peptidase SppA [Natronosalvus rutilus]